LKGTRSLEISSPRDQSAEVRQCRRINLWLANGHMVHATRSTIHERIETTTPRRAFNLKEPADRSLPCQSPTQDQNRDAADTELPALRRYGQNERARTLGRKARLVTGSQTGGDRTALMYSLIVTAKKYDPDPREWLADVLARLPGLPVSRPPDLLPWI